MHPSLLQDIKDKVDLSVNGFAVAGKWVIIVMAAINILREIFQIYQVCMLLNYSFLPLLQVTRWTGVVVVVLRLIKKKSGKVDLYRHFDIT